ncbi:polysaccharide deacetylase family protein [Terrisporobacter sp.]|uniref:polysaccharide deacetylase family protein n=1 Tax=Terrisporobacter sp. TaxID=1965305 RepID=UPI0026256B96|nr:polysaccharide deacetylase family protein [Terrisporobacter sp.]
MMFKKKLSIISLVIILFCSSISSVYADEKKSLIIYEVETNINETDNKVNYLNELLYVFNSKVEKINTNDYKTGYMNKFHSVFIVNIKYDIENKSVLQDLSKYKNKIYWIEDKIENLIDFNDKYDMSYESKNHSINKLIYRDETLLIESGDLFNIIKPSKDSKVLAQMSDGFNTYPFIINEKNLFYISRWDLDESYIFEDSLNDFYESNKFNKGDIFVRIEDVHPFTDTNKLREVADYLYSQDVPFMIALIPTFVDSKTKTINTLDLNPEYIETIKYMQDKGGSVILHGYTHQIGNEEVSGEGYEFWDMKNDKPIDEDIEIYVKDRILSGLRLCIKNGIYPLGFEAPHYAMNIHGYKEIKKYFSTYVGQYQNNDYNFVTNSPPYTIENSNAFNKLIPENLGYVDDTDMFSIDKIKENFKKLSMVRGYSGGFFFHPYLDIEYLKEVVEYLKDERVDFIDLKEQDNYVKIDDINITSKNGNIRVSYDESKSISKNNEKSKFETFIQNINNVVITFIVAVLILFIIIFIVFRRINTNKFTRR